VEILDGKFSPLARMRYEVQAPSQEPSWAVGAITEYADRLKKVASGGKAPGAAADPACPY